MGYVRFPLSSPHTFKMCTSTLKKLCTDKTHTPGGIMPKTTHVHKSESSKATQMKQSKQTDEPVVPKINWNTDLIELNGRVRYQSQKVTC